jgi:plastocyanin
MGSLVIVSHHRKEQSMSFSRFISNATLAAIVAFASFAMVGVHAENSVEIALSYKDKKFDPAEISAPANTPIVIKFRNLDKDAMELESDSLHIEKVVAAGKDATIKVKAQKPGRYEFFDEYNEKTARGALVVK